MRWARALLLPLAAFAAQCAKDPTGLYVSVTVDRALGDNVNFMVVRIFDGSVPSMNMPPPISERPFVVTPGQTYSLFVEKSGTRSRVRVEVDGGRGMLGGGVTLPLPGAGSVSDRVQVAYVEDQVLKVEMNLWAACRSGVLRMPCGPDTRCTSAGTCVPSTLNNPTRHRW